MGWFEKKIEDLTDDELQARLVALVERLTATQTAIYSDLERYERLLAEIYKRGLTPNKWLTAPKEKL